MKNIYPILILMSCWPLYAKSDQIIDLDQPDDPYVCVPAIIYRSPFQDYQRQGTIKIKSWPKANQSVTDQSMDHTQHMNMPMGGTTSPSAPASHSNHQMKGSE